VVALVAVTGRRLGRPDRWPYPNASVSPRAYLAAVERAGAEPVVVDPHHDLTGLLPRIDAVVLTGGADVDPSCYGEEPHATVYGVDREADDREIALARAAIDRGVPLLAICRGIQVLNVAFGGTLHQDIVELPDVEAHGRPGEPGGAHTHAVEIADGSLLHAAMGARRVTASCHHHQAVNKIGTGLRITATAGDGIVEGLEIDGAWALAVQWHPEDTAPTDPVNQALFDALVRRATN
jgi:putative glutamine amidotransferase